MAHKKLSAYHFRLNTKSDDDDYMTSFYAKARKELSKSDMALLEIVGEGSQVELDPSQLVQIGHLIRKGFVKEDRSTLEELVEYLPSSLQKPIRTYVKVAMERSVSDTEIDSAYKSLTRKTGHIKEFVEDYAQLRGLDEEHEKSLLDSITKAKTRSDKIVAIDQIVGLQDSFGISLPFLADEKDIDTDTVQGHANRLLNRLAYD